MSTPLINVGQAFNSFRDNGYRDVQSAVAELIDNSIEAGASRIECIVLESKSPLVSPRSRPIIDSLYVIDNGKGMDPSLIEKALTIGDGSKINSRSGIGRFGMGLPASSISQCKLLEIWSRVEFEDFHYCCLDVDKIVQGSVTEIPTPIPSSLDEYICKASSLCSSPSGTCVKWSNLDRLVLDLSSGLGVAKRIQYHASRIYRNFIKSGEVEISVICIKNLDFTHPVYSTKLKPWDPLFLMEHADVPPPFNGSHTMFKLYDTEVFEVPYTRDGTTSHSAVTIRSSHCIYEARNPDGSIEWPASYANAGASPWGKLADKVKGVSIVRAGRELAVDSGWINGSDPTERWWRIEVSFEPVLDELFGVSNNKQFAHNFVNGSTWSPDDEKEENETTDQMLSRLKSGGDSRAYLMDIWLYIDRVRYNLRKEKDKLASRRSTRSVRRHNTGTDGTQKTPIPRTIEQEASSIIARQDADERPSKTLENALEKTKEQIYDEQLRAFKERRRMDEDSAKAIVDKIARDELRVTFRPAPLDDIEMFKVHLDMPQTIDFVTNTQHEAYKAIFKSLDEIQDEEYTPEQELALYEDAYYSLKLLFLSWARMADEKATNRSDLTKIQQVLQWWSVAVAEMFQDAHLDT
jgi:hypothetical protein